METPNLNNNKQNTWQFNAPQFVDFGDENTFQNNDAANDQFFMDAKENDEFYSPRSNMSMQSEFETPAEKTLYDFRQTPLREIKNHGGTPYREPRLIRLFGKRSISVKTPRSKSAGELSEDNENCHQTPSNRDTFNVSSIQEALGNIEQDTLEASKHPDESEQHQNDEDTPSTVPEGEATFCQANASRLAEDLENTPVNESRRSSYVVNSPVIARVTFQDPESQNVTPSNESNNKKAIASRKATPMVRMSLNTSTIIKARRSNLKVPELSDVNEGKPAPKVTFANTNTVTKAPQNKARIESRVRQASKSLTLKNRPPLHMPKRVANISMADKSMNNVSMANRTVSGNQTFNEKRKRCFNVPSTESAYNFMNSMRNYSPLMPIKNKKPTPTVAVAPKFMTENRVCSRTTVPNHDATKPAAPKVAVKVVSRMIPAKNAPKLAGSKPQQKVSSKPTQQRVTARPQQSQKTTIAALNKSNPAGLTLLKRATTKAVTPHFASDDRIKLWHRKHDDADHVDAPKAPLFRAKPAPNFKKLHARSKIAQNALIPKSGAP